MTTPNKGSKTASKRRRPVEPVVSDPVVHDGGCELNRLEGNPIAARLVGPAATPLAGTISVDDLARSVASDPDLWRRYKSSRERAEVAVHMLRVIHDDGVSLRELARRMQTSLSQVRRLVDPKRTGSATVSSLSEFARATGRELSVLFETEGDRDLRMTWTSCRSGSGEAPLRWSPMGGSIGSSLDRHVQAQLVQVMVMANAPHRAEDIWEVKNLSAAQIPNRLPNEGGGE